MSKQSDPLKTTAQELHPDKPTIIITGDSWAKGEWKNQDVTHAGLEHYLQNDNYNILNLGMGGGSNSLSLLQLFRALCGQKIPNPKNIFFFWTDWQRDFDQNVWISNTWLGDLIDGEPNSLWPKKYDEDLPHQYSYRIFKELETIANRSEIPIGLIGGCCDVVDVGGSHPGVYTVCQSFTNLCINDEHKINDLVLTIFTNPQYGQSRLKSETFLKDMEKANKRMLLWHNHPEWFWPDGLHANRHAHLKLFNFLKNENHI